MAEPDGQSRLRRTPLNRMHREAGARMVGFGGWDMPVYYAGIVAEHKAVRSGVGLFDVSHMGEIEIRGPQSVDLIDSLCSNRAASLLNGQVQYSGLLNRQGGFVDDLLVHRISPDHYLLCVNAANQEGDFAWIRDNNEFEAELDFASERYAQLAIQGPSALAVASRLTDVDLAGMRYYWFAHGDFAGVPAMVARTGYTGEDGFEVYIPPAAAEHAWLAILRAGSGESIRPCGLGARNTLRLEAAMSLYGHEIDAEVTPYEAGLGWIVKLAKPAFLGREVLARQEAEGVDRRIAGFEMRGRGIARDGYRVLVDGQAAGRVTSASPAPHLGRNIGLCMLPVEFCSAGRSIDIEIRGRAVAAQIVRLPFYRRKRS
ncbi:MAG: glycine cleavage system aminomethyltransferase GcvT [Bryobacterales bacterium]|nr:glycine cleavage system aminomethyltransferase GcvT [Bryobacterales bacterium]